MSRDRKIARLYFTLDLLRHRIDAAMEDTRRRSLDPEIDELMISAGKIEDEIERLEEEER